MTVNHALTTINLFFLSFLFFNETFVLSSDPHATWHTRPGDTSSQLSLRACNVSGPYDDYRVKPQQMATHILSLHVYLQDETSQAAPFSMLWPARRLCGHAVGLYNCGPEWRADSGWLSLTLVTFSFSEVSAWKQSFVPGADRFPTVGVPIGIPT